MAEPSNYNLLEIKWFEEFLAAYKIDDVIRPDRETIETFRDKLPNYLLRF